MPKEKYLKQRNELIQQAQAALAKGDLENSKAIRAKIEKLDNDYNEAVREAANIASLQGIQIPQSAPVNPQAINLGDGASAVIGGAAAPQPEAYLHAFAKHMLGRSLTRDEQTAFNVVNPEAMMTESENHVVVPTTMVESIWREFGEAHPILAKLRKTNIKGDVDVPVETDSGSDGEWVDEKTTPTESKPALSSISLSGCELSKSANVSWKLKKMSIDAFIFYITALVAEKMGNALAKGIISGKGHPGNGETFKAQAKGIITALAAETNTPQIVTYTNSISYANLTTLMSKIKSGYMAGAEIYATNTTIWTQLATIVDSTGKPMFIPDVTGQSIGKLFGVPVQEEDGMADGEVLLSNVAKGYYMNVNEDITMYYEDHVLDRNTDYMGYAIVDGSPISNKASALLKKSA